MKTASKSSLSSFERGSCDGFPKSLASVEHILRLTGKKHVLPKFCCEKGFLLNQSSQNKAAKYYKEFCHILGEERFCRKGNLSIGYWHENKKLITVENAVGSVWKCFGTTKSGLLYALPEEAMFLVEQGVFELFLNELPLCVKDCWILLLNHMPSFEYYNVYTLLCRQGFRVVSDKKHLHFPAAARCPPLSNHGELVLKTSIHGGTACTLAKSLPTEVRYLREKNVEPNHVQESCIMLGIELENHVGGSQETAGLLHYRSPNVCPSDCNMARKFIEDISPLISPEDAVSVKAVLKKLQIIKPRQLQERKSERSIDALPTEGAMVDSNVNVVVGPNKVALQDDTGLSNFVRARLTMRSALVTSSMLSPSGIIYEDTPINCEEMSFVRSEESEITCFTSPIESQMKDINFLQSSEHSFLSCCSFHKEALSLARINKLNQVKTMSSTSSCNIDTAGEIYFDVCYSKGFKKSDHGLIKCRIYPCGHKTLPMMQMLENILGNSRNIPIRFGVFDQGCITFYSLMLTNVCALLLNDG